MGVSSALVVALATQFWVTGCRLTVTLLIEIEFEQLPLLLRLSLVVFFFSSRRRHTRCSRDWSSDVCSSDLEEHVQVFQNAPLDVLAAFQVGVSNLLVSQVGFFLDPGLNLNLPLLQLFRSIVLVLSSCGFALFDPVDHQEHVIRSGLVDLVADVAFSADCRHTSPPISLGCTCGCNLGTSM